MNDLHFCLKGVKHEEGDEEEEEEKKGDGEVALLIICLPCNKKTSLDPQNPSTRTR